MASGKHGALLVVGSGPQIGVHTASQFASHGFRNIVLLSRNASRLSEDAAAVKAQASAADVAVHTVAADIADTAALKKDLQEVGNHLGNTPLECVLFNAARVGVSKILEFPAEQVENDLRICVTGLYTVAQWAMPQLVKLASDSSGYKPTLLVTNGTIRYDPYPAFFSLSLCKAAQSNLTTSLNKEFGPKGVHCALVVVADVVKDDAENCNPKNIAEKMWGMYSQEKQDWALDIEIKDSVNSVLEV